MRKMKFSAEVEKYLLDVPKPSNWVPDEYDVAIAGLMRDRREIDKADALIFGIPFDTAVMGRRGCRFGPEGVRSALVFQNVYNPSYDVDLSTGFVVSDLGNVDVPQTEVPGCHKRVEAVSTDAFKTGADVVIIGGDHSLSYPDVKGLMNAVEGRVGVIMIDGHLDVRISQHGEISSGTPFRRLMEEAEKPLLGKNFVEIGINGWLNSARYMNYCREKGVTVIPARQVHRRGIDDVLKEALDKAADGTEAIFLSVDADGLDSGAMPGTCAPNPGGLATYQALEAVWQIGRHPKTRGLDIMEVAPCHDPSGITSMTAASLIMTYLGAVKARREAAE
jgi:formimidoylglutamase